MTRLYDIMRKYRGNTACILLSCRGSGMKVSPCNEESCAEGMRSACAEQVLRDVFGASCAAPEPFEKTRDDRLFSLYAFLRKYAVVIVCFRTRRDGLL